MLGAERGGPVSEKHGVDALVHQHVWLHLSAIPEHFELLGIGAQLVNKIVDDAVLRAPTNDVSEPKQPGAEREHVTVGTDERLAA